MYIHLQHFLIQTSQATGREKTHRLTCLPTGGFIFCLLAWKLQRLLRPERKQSFLLFGHFNYRPSSVVPTNNLKNMYAINIYLNNTHTHARTYKYL